MGTFDENLASKVCNRIFCCTKHNFETTLIKFDDKPLDDAIWQHTKWIEFFWQKLQQEVLFETTNKTNGENSWVDFLTL